MTHLDPRNCIFIFQDPQNYIMIHLDPRNCILSFLLSEIHKFTLLEIHTFRRWRYWLHSSSSDEETICVSPVSSGGCSTDSATDTEDWDEETLKMQWMRKSNFQVIADGSTIIKVTVPEGTWSADTPVGRGGTPPPSYTSSSSSNNSVAEDWVVR